MWIQRATSRFWGEKWTRDIFDTILIIGGLNNFLWSGYSLELKYVD